MTFEQIEATLVAYPRFRKEPDFVTVKHILEKMKYDNDIPIVHVAGTNGKGSVIMMLSSMLRECGLDVGVFTSPHIVDIRERMQINGKLMPKEEFVRRYHELQLLVEESKNDGFAKPTFFEWIFLMAMGYFSDKKPDVLLIETGLGGKHDTTNVLENKILTIITSIGLDHVGILGNTVEEIAEKKAGILRQEVPAVYYNETEAVNRVIEDACTLKNAQLIDVLPFDVKILKRSEESIDFYLGNKYYNYEALRSNAVTDYQTANVKIALTSIDVLSEYFEIDKVTAIKGLRNFEWIGRMHYLTENFLLDGAHNVAGITAFVKTVNNNGHENVDVLFSCMPDKQMDEMVDALREMHSIRTVYIPLTHFFERASADKIAQCFMQKGFESVIVLENLEHFINDRLSFVGARTLLVCVGSLYLVGEVIKITRRTLHD